MGLPLSRVSTKNELKDNLLYLCFLLHYLLVSTKNELKETIKNCLVKLIVFSINKE